jgi:Type I phosphodiesterase / nucleotide pyrophosphatase
MTGRPLILALADGLRPEAVTPDIMPALSALSRHHTSATDAQTVRPSATVAALASLATGVGPDTHRLVQPGLDFLPRVARLRPVARELARRGVPADVVTAELPLPALPVAWALAQAAGVRRLFPAGRRAPETAVAAQWILEEDDAGLVFVYLPDCDVAGHAHGWMSSAYVKAAAEVDRAIAYLAPHADDALLIVVADHGGGGVLPTEHDQPHPLNDRIPLVLAGPQVAPAHPLDGPVSLLDVSATILWWFGIPVPDVYEGRPLLEAFVPALPLAAVAS